MANSSQAHSSQSSFLVGDDLPVDDDDTRLENHPTDPPPSLELKLTVRDRDVVDALWRRDAGRPRDSFAVDALRIGVMALRHASSQVDVDLVRNASAELLANLQGALEQHARLAHQQTTEVLKNYFDPQNGRLPERINRLVSDDGELAQLLKNQLHGDASPLARTLGETLGKHVGGESPLMKLLDPEQAKGVVASLQRAVDGELAKQREHVLKEFSLDNKAGALRRLVDELTGRHGDLSKDLQGKIDEVVKEFSLDEENSALSRLVRNVDQAQRTIRSEFSLDNDESGLSRLKKQLMETLESHIATNHKFQEEVKTTLAKLEQKRESDAKSTQHGHSFEEAVLTFIQDDSQPRGDIVDSTGTTTGIIRNCQKGDVVVQLGPDSVAAGCRIVVEAKDDRGYSLGKALDELETARKNRRADVGVFVFARATAPQGLRPLQRFRSDLVVVWDAEDPSTDAYLLAALEIARACSIEYHRGQDAAEVDVEGVEKAINEIEKRAANFDQIRKPAETIKLSSEKILERVRIDQQALERQVLLLREKLAALRSPESP